MADHATALNRALGSLDRGRSTQLPELPGWLARHCCGKDCAGLRGYSAFASPHQLRDYLQDLAWVGSAEVCWDERTVLAFHGKEVGRGEDGEPLVVPDWDQSCCGQTVHAQMPWEEFTARLEHTMLPTSPWDTAKGRHVSPFYWQERHERRHPAESRRPADRGRRAGRDLEPGG